MGWFWADAEPARPVPPHSVPATGATPPPGCPMHTKSTPAPASPPASCPINSRPPPLAAPSTASSPRPSSTSTTLSKLNPLNMMPSIISNTRDSTHQQIALDLEREASNIPRGDGEQGNWEYPSPQQMYNAMLRKGYTDTDASAVPAMVAVHNFLNEGAWNEILGWEARFGRGLRRGWEVCGHGEENAEYVMDMMDRRERMERGRAAAQLGLGGAAAGTARLDAAEARQPSLVRFMGRPDEPTPKARAMQLLGRVWPSRYASEPPFDRHDWFVIRNLEDGSTREVRYVIDYYSGPPEPTGEPVFFLDVRPAVDTPTAACERLLRWGGDVWWRASGGVVRAEKQLEAGGRTA